jgi:hypothetical protein
LSDSESPVGKISDMSIQEPSREINTAESKEDTTAYETDNESDCTGNRDVIVEEQDQPNLDAVTGEYDSSEAMDVVDSE